MIRTIFRNRRVQDINVFFLFSGMYQPQINQSIRKFLFDNNINN